MVTCSKKPNKWFVKDTYEHQPASTNKCVGCGNEWRSIKNNPILLKRFENMVGLKWRAEWTSVVLPLKKDFHTLNRDTIGVPQGIALCLGCAIDYMESFNRELAEMKKERFRSR